MSHVRQICGIAEPSLWGIADGVYVDGRKWKVDYATPSDFKYAHPLWRVVLFYAPFWSNFVKCSALRHKVLLFELCMQKIDIYKLVRLGEWCTLSRRSAGPLQSGFD